MFTDGGCRRASDPLRRDEGGDAINGKHHKACAATAWVLYGAVDTKSADAFEPLGFAATYYNHMDPDCPELVFDFSGTEVAALDAGIEFIHSIVSPEGSA